MADDHHAECRTDQRRRARRVLLCATAAVVLLLTLSPLPSERPVNRVGLLPQAHVGGVRDSIENVLLFVPVGASLAAVGAGRLVVIAIACLFSATIELTQIAVPGRFPGVPDVGFNTLGALGGAWMVGGSRGRRLLDAALERGGALLAAAVRPPRRASAPLAVVAAGVTLALPAAGSWLAAPAVPARQMVVAGPALDFLAPRLSIGGGIQHTGFCGRIDEVRLYATARTSSAILATLGRPLDPHDVDTPRLLAAYTFDTLEGSVAEDVSGHRQHGQLRGARWTAEGRHGGALHFDGGEATVLVDRREPRLATTFTLEAWVWPDREDCANVVVEEAGALTLRAGAEVGGRPSAAGMFSTLTDVTVGSAQLPPRAWSHLAVVHDTTSLRLIVNGRVSSELLRTFSRASQPPLVNGLRLAPGPLTDPQRFARDLRNGLAIGLELPPQLSGRRVPLLDVRTHYALTVLRVMLREDDLIISYRSRAQALGFPRGEIVVPRVRRLLPTDRAARLDLTGNVRQVEARLDGQSLGVVGLRPSGWWRSVVYSGSMSPALIAAISVVVAVLTSVPAGYYAASFRGSVVLLVSQLLALRLLAPALGLGLPTSLDVASVVFGWLAGWAMRRLGADRA